MSTLLRDSPGSSQMALGPDAALGSPLRLIKLDSAPAPRTDVFGWVYRALIRSLDFVRLIRERGAKLPCGATCFHPPRELVMIRFLG